jgi:DNA-binding IclR family transcriptional regulator
MPSLSVGVCGAFVSRKQRLDIPSVLPRLSLCHRVGPRSLKLWRKALVQQSALRDYSQAVNELAATPGAVDKAMLVLGALITHGRPLRLAELTRITGLAKATVHRLVTTLRQHKMMDLQDDRYILGERLTGVVGWHDGRYRQLLSRVSTPYLVELHVATGFNVSLGVLAGDEVVYVNRVFGHHGAKTNSFSADRVPARATAIGKILLAYSPRSVSEAKRHTEDAAELSRVRQSGIAQRSKRHPQDVTCVAVLVHPGYGTHPPTALVLSGPAGLVEPSSVSVELRGVAHRLSRAILRAVSTSPVEAAPALSIAVGDG